MLVPEQLRKLIAKDGRTQTEIADAARMVRGKLSQFMTRGINVSYDALERLAHALGAQIVVIPPEKKPASKKPPKKSAGKRANAPKKPQAGKKGRSK
jgi:transcriptional regulator with XRE-family HTH domain